MISLSFDVARFKKLGGFIMADVDLKNIIRGVADFPKKGILFYDITTVLNDPQALAYSIDKMANTLSEIDFDLIVSPESRGFIFGMPLAYKLNKGFVPARKPGKLPYTTVSKSYALEYGTNSIEVHIDAIKQNQKVVIVDDLLATGGTCKALAELVEEIGGKVVGFDFLVELNELNGRQTLSKYDNIFSVVEY